MTDFKQDVLSISGSAEKLAGDKVSKGSPLLKRARAIQQTRSVTRMLVIDKETETFGREVVSVAGLAEVLQQFSLRLAAAADMPVTLLMGQSPAGLSATGASDIRFFYDRIASIQRRILLPRVKKLIRLLFLASDGPTGGEEPERWTVTMNSLYQLSASEEATRRLAIAQADAIYLTNQVTNPEEVAVSRFGGADYSAETTIDFEGRAQMAAQEAKERAAKLKAAMQPPKPIVAGQPPPPDPNPKQPVEPSSVE
jgi:phage-related protein (TIGR01555 family)